MALPPSPNQKRKRGRPSNASKAVSASTSRQPQPPAAAEGEHDELDMEEQSRPRKRGRKPAEAATDAVSSHPRKRGRPSLGKVPEAEAASDAASAKPRKRGRPSLAKAPEVEASTAEQSRRKPNTQRSVQVEGANEDELADDEVDIPSSVTKPPKRSRRDRASMNQGAEEPAEEDQLAEDVEVVSKRKRGRPSLNGPRAPEAGKKAKGKKPGRPSLPRQNAADTATPDAAITKRRGRVPRSSEPTAPSAEADSATKKRRARVSQGDVPAPSPSESLPRRRGRPRTSDVTSSNATQDPPSQPRKAPKRPSGAAKPTPPAKRRRIALEEAPESPPPAPPKFRQITTRTRHIPRSTIDSKWTPLEPPSINLISSLLHLAERPVLQRLSVSDKRREQAASAMRIVSRRLTNKLSKGLPFPPAAVPATKNKTRGDGGREEELDFESVVMGLAALERQLDPLQHAVELLKGEKEKAEAALERDYEVLTELETNARAEARERRDKLRKAHVLVPEPKGEEDHNEKNRLELVADEDSRGVLFKDLRDPELQGIAAQISSHMESLRGNLAQIEGVVPQVVKSKAVLRDVLFKHLDQQHYETVLFG